MSYLSNLKTEASYTGTMNGAKTHGSTGDACLDFFAVAGGMRYRRPEDQIRLFERAYIETPELAMKLLFHLRDIRGGMGERKLFRTLIKHVACTWPKSARKNVCYIAEFGCWDDLLCLLGTPAKRLINALEMNAKEYRRVVTALRARIGLAERQLTARRPEKVNYEAVPAQAMLKYRNAFKRRDGERFEEYLTGVFLGEKRIHTGTLFPYEVLRPFFRGGYRFRGVAEGADALEALWDHLPGAVGNVNAISVVDTSGSMYCAEKLKPALISQAMGLYCAERCEGVFHNHLITFESTPHLMEIHGATLQDKLRYIGSLPWGGSTNLEAVLDLILRTAVKSRAKQSEMPQVLYIFSDMEFNCAMSNADMTVYESAKRKFEAVGYHMPAVVFHNVNSWQMQTPVTAHTRGTALTSGASTHALSHRFDGNVTPMDHMLRVLNGERYAMIHA